ncbi:hypothetical protein RB598_002154 [Gaeumannomyces tritici]
MNLGIRKLYSSRGHCQKADAIRCDQTAHQPRQLVERGVGPEDPENTMSDTHTTTAPAATTTTTKRTTPEGTGPEGIRLGTTAEAAAAEVMPAAISSNLAPALAPATPAAAEKKTRTAVAAAPERFMRKDSSAAAVVAAIAAATSTRGPTVKTPLTHYPLAGEAVLERNARRLAGKPYARYLNRSLEMYSDAAEALQAPMPRSGVLPLADAGRLLEAGHHAHENGWCGLADGAAYAASLRRFPRDCTGDMLRWWFWWHAVESERYALWYPHAHIRVTLASSSSSPSPLSARPGRDRLAAMADRTAPHVRKWLGRTHRVEELLGERRVSAHLRFVDPARYGLPWDRLRAAGYEAAVCAEVRDGWEPRLKVGDVVHLWRRLAPAEGGGLELRSRYWLGTGVRLDLPLVRVAIPLDRVAGLLGLKAARGGARTAYDMFLHDQSEFTNLASFLPQIYGDFLAGRLGDY